MNRNQTTVVTMCLFWCVAVCAQNVTSLAATAESSVVPAPGNGDGADTVVLLKGESDTTAGLQAGGAVMELRMHSVMARATNAVEKTRRQGYGIGGGFSPGVAGLSMKPVYTMISRELILKNKIFPGLTGGYNPILMTGGLGYLGFGNGMRVGGGGWSGMQRYSSDPYTTANGDSIAVLSINFGYGGLLLEKTWLHDRWNIIAGGMWTFGSIEVVPDFFSSNTAGQSAFAGLNTTGSDKSAKAGFTGLELHGGVTYSVFSWMHLGVDVNGLFFLSASGYAGQGGANGFVGASPGGRVRLIFGNLG